MERHIYDLIIIGGGPAGLSAAVYALRAKRDVIVIEERYDGGQIANTSEVDNYLGLPMINGFDMAMKFSEHVANLGLTSIKETVVSLETEGTLHRVKTSSETYLTRTVILATGAHPRKLGVKGEAEYNAAGVSYCAVCDGAFYRNKTVAVVGGGDVAVEDALYLSRLCAKVYLIHRRRELRAEKISQELLFKAANVEVLWDSVVDEIVGEVGVTGAQIRDVKTQEIKTIALDGIFIGIGTEANTGFLIGSDLVDANGTIPTDQRFATVRPGVYAAGDVRADSVKQIIVAASEGAQAMLQCDKYLNEHTF